jgi:hypothetical protein
MSNNDEKIIEFNSNTESINLGDNSEEEEDIPVNVIKEDQDDEDQDDEDQEDEDQDDEDQDDEDQDDEDQDDEDQEDEDQEDEEIDLGEEEEINLGENSNTETIDLFDEEDTEITVIDKEDIPEYERDYTDNIYEQVLQNEFLSELDIDKQNSVYFQELILKKVNTIIELKNRAIELNNKGSDYNLIRDQILKNNFIKSVYPIVLDKQKIFQIKESDENNTVKQSIEDKLFGDKNGYLIEDQDDQLRELKTLDDKFYSGEIKYNTYYQEIANLFNAYPLDHNKLGYKTKSPIYQKVLRYYNLLTSHWKDHKVIGESQFYHEVVNQYTKQKESVKQVIIKGQEMSIVGLYINYNGSERIHLNGEPIMAESKFGKLSKITKIQSTGKSKEVKITVPNHQIDPKDKSITIYLSETKSLPSIDGLYKNINVVDKDTLIINIKGSLIKESLTDSGYIFTNLLIDAKIYNVIVEKSGKVVIKEGSKVIDNKKIWVSGDSVIYLFNEKELNFEEYKKIVNTVVPDYLSIIKNELDVIRKKSDLMKINNYLENKYGFSLFTIDYDSYLLVIKELSNKIKDIENDIKKEESESKSDSKSKKVGEKISLLYSDKYFKNKDIQKIYGVYPYFDKANDNNITRSQWINNQTDNGIIYYMFVSIDLEKKDDVKKIKNEIEKDLEVINKKIKDEKTAKSYFKEEKDCSIYKKSYHSIKDLTQDQTKYENGDLAIIRGIDKDGIRVLTKDDGKVFIWDKDKWTAKGETSFDSIQQMCDFGSIDFDKINIDNIICVYEDKCQPSKLLKLEKKRENLEKYIEFLNQNKGDSYKTDFYKSLLKEYELGKSEDTHREEKKEESDDKLPTKTSSSIIINKIRKVENAELRSYLIYKLIEQDGIIINDFIYSKKYSEKMLCAHYYLLTLSQNTADPVKQGELYQDMLSKFGDDGYSVTGFKTCKICGSELNEVDYDESGGLNQLGERRIERDILEEREVDTEMVMRAETLQVDEYGKLNCRDPLFKKKILEFGISSDRLENAYKLCDTMNNIGDKIGTGFRVNDILTVIRDTLLNIREINSPIRHKKIEILRLKEKRGLSLEKINQLEKRGYFRDVYKRYQMSYKNKLNMTLGSRILILLQTAIPEYIIGKIKVPCSFRGYEGSNGIEFMSCVLRKMGILTDIYKTELGVEQIRPISEKYAMEQISYIYTKFMEKPEISMLFQRKMVDKSVKQKIVKDVENLDNGEDIDFGKDIKIDLDFIKQVKESNDSSKFYESYIDHRTYLQKKLMREIYNVVVAAEFDMMNPEVESVAMGSCCAMEANQKTYDFYDKEGNIKEIREKLDEIERYNDLFLHKGSFTFNVESSDIQYITSNDDTNCDLKLTNPLILQKFITFCSKGISRGYSHIFNKDGKCIRCTETLDEIRGNKYNANDYYALMDDIQRLTATKIVEGVNITNFQDFDKVQHECSENYEPFMIQFVNKLSKLLNKSQDGDFYEKYLEILKNIGLTKNELDNMMENIKNTNEYTINEKILYESVQKNRITNIKNYINNYFRYYISLLGNKHFNKEHKIKFDGMDTDTAIELQKKIYDKSQELAYFNETACEEIFKKLKFDYTIDEINSINGVPPVYNYKKTKILKETPFSFAYAANMLIYILLIQLNSFFQIDFKGNDKENLKVYGSIATFIVKILDMINEEMMLVDIDKKEYEKIVNRLYYDKRCKIEKEAEKMTDAEQSMIQTTLNLENIDEYNFLPPSSETVYDAEKAMKDKEEAIIQKAKEKLGSGATENEIETFKEEYEKEMEIEKQEYDDNFNMFQMKEGLDVMEVGDDYGEMPQGTENEGDGFNDFTQAELFGGN